MNLAIGLQMSIPSAVNTQKDQARDLRLIFTDKVTVKFILKDNSVETPAGREFKKKQRRIGEKTGKAQSFFHGG